MTKISIPTPDKNLIIWIGITFINLLLTIFFDLAVTSGLNISIAAVLWFAGIMLSENIKEIGKGVVDLPVALLIIINEIYVVFAGAMKVFGKI